MNLFIELRKVSSLIVISVVLVCFGIPFVPKGFGVMPPPDGGYANFNTAEGQNALFSLTSGAANTAVGWFSLDSVTTGSFNTGVGAGTLVFNTGNANTATGVAALLLNTTGVNNTANGAAALVSNSAGEDNTAVGAFALNANDGGFANTAVGSLALTANVGGIDNTAVGHIALQSNTTGGGNTAVGDNTLVNVTNTDLNTALGVNAGNNVVTAHNVICIRSPGEDISDSCYIGNIYSNAQPIVGVDPDSVTITSSGRLGRGNVSSRRYKHDIRPMKEASEALYALKPVSFRYNKEYDATQTLAFGLIAEDVAEVYPDLVGRNLKGQPESVRYDQINALLLNEFLKEHRAFIKEQKKVQEQERAIQQEQATITELRQQMAGLIAHAKEQDLRIQRVTDQLQTGRRSMQMVSVP